MIFRLHFLWFLNTEIVKVLQCRHSSSPAFMLFYLANTMTADDLATQGPCSSATKVLKSSYEIFQHLYVYIHIVLQMLNQYNLVSWIGTKSEEVHHLRIKLTAARNSDQTINTSWNGKWPFVWRIHRSQVYSLHKVMLGFDIFYEIRMDTFLNKQFDYWWFETPWRSCVITVMSNHQLDGSVQGRRNSSEVSNEVTSFLY